MVLLIIETHSDHHFVQPVPREFILKGLQIIIWIEKDRNKRNIVLTYSCISTDVVSKN